MTRKRRAGGMKATDAEGDELELEATRIAREMLAACLGELMELALKICMGIKRKRFYPPHILELRLKDDPKARKFYYEIEYDSAMIRFLIERFIPPAKTAMDLNVKTLEEFYRAIEQAKSSERTFQ